MKILCIFILKKMVLKFHARGEKFPGSFRDGSGNVTGYYYYYLLQCSTYCYVTIMYIRMNMIF